MIAAGQRSQSDAQLRRSRRKRKLASSICRRSLPVADNIDARARDHGNE